MLLRSDSDKRANLIADGADAAGSLMALPRNNSGLSIKSTSEDTSSPQVGPVLVEGRTGKGNGVSRMWP